MAMNFHKRNKGFVSIISAIIAGVFMLSIFMGAFGGSSRQTSTSTEDYIKAVEEQLAKKPKDYQLLVDLGNSYMSLADSQKSDLSKTKSSNATYDKAVNYYKRAIAINDKDISVRTDMAISLYYSGKVDEAIKTVEKVIKESPKFAAAHFNYGIFLTSKSDFKKAIEELKLAKDLEPTAFSQNLDSMIPSFEQMLKTPASNTAGTTGSQGTVTPGSTNGNATNPSTPTTETKK
jgi:tetratricopeptide (TPR) repeat protein